MKVYNYMVVTVGLIILIQLAGIGGGFNDLFTNMGVIFNEDNSFSSQTFSNSQFYLKVFSLTAGLFVSLGLGIGIGFLTKSSSENYVILPFIIGTLYLYVAAWTAIMAEAKAYEPWVTATVWMILIPLSVGFIIALVEFFRGTD